MFSTNMFGCQILSNFFPTKYFCDFSDFFHASLSICRSPRHHGPSLQRPAPNLTSSSLHHKRKSKLELTLAKPWAEKGLAVASIRVDPELIWKKHQINAYNDKIPNMTQNPIYTYKKFSGFIATSIPQWNLKNFLAVVFWTHLPYFSILLSV